jgi:carbamoylphosphate synthase small subunit
MDILRMPHRPFLLQMLDKVYNCLLLIFTLPNICNVSTRKEQVTDGELATSGPDLVEMKLTISLMACPSIP